MESILYQRIKKLCDERGITINKLEKEIGVGYSSIQKWKNTYNPSMDKINKIANYFNVSLDYLLGRTDIRTLSSDIIGDDFIISLQRAREKMPPQDRERMMKVVRSGFDYFFTDEDN